MVIVECYSSKEQAQTGHKKWIKIMTKKELPKELIDCNNSSIMQLSTTFGGGTIFPRKVK